MYCYDTDELEMSYRNVMDRINKEFPHTIGSIDELKQYEQLILNGKIDRYSIFISNLGDVQVFLVKINHQVMYLIYSKRYSRIYTAIEEDCYKRAYRADKYSVEIKRWMEASFKKRYTNRRRSLTTERIILFAKSDSCGICGERIRNFEDSSVDHIVPLSKGGSNHMSNLQISHRRCNDLKGTRKMTKSLRKWVKKEIYSI